MSDMNNIAANMGDSIKAFRSAAVSAENKATPMARSIIAALLTGASSPDKVVATVIASFGNPKSPKSGKPIDKLSGLRDFVGGDSTRKTVETVLKIVENVKADDSGTLLPLATDFVLATANAPKSLRALEVNIKDAMRAAAAADMGTADETAETNVDDDATAPAAPAGPDLNAVALYIGAMDDDAFAAASDAVAALRAAIAARMDAYTTARLKIAA